MSKSGIAKGYKVFNPDWTCRKKQYTCPGKFEEDITPSVMKVCTSVKRRLIASVITASILKIRLRKWLPMARLRKMGINVVLTSWKSCVKSRGLNCLKS